MEKRLIIIDSNALLHRAFHALPPLTTKQGEPTGAVYGFLLTLFKALKDTSANYAVACFDTPARTFRHEKFAEYKGHRSATPDGIKTQIPKTKEILEKLQIPIFAKDGFEADDLIATICRVAQEQDKTAEIFIVSGDLDNLQLVNERVKVYTLGRGIKDTIIYDTEKVVERCGVSPSQMVDFKALLGDPSDNIPGVAGIGKKTAAELIQKFGSVENLYKEMSIGMASLKPKVKDALIDHKQSALMSRELAQMKNDAPVEFNLDACKFGNFDKNQVAQILEKFEFNTLINKINSWQK